MMTFRYPLSDDTELRLLEPRYAEELYTLVHHNREHFSRWLSWVPACQGVEDRRAFLARCMQETAEHGSFLAAIWHGGVLAGRRVPGERHHDGRRRRHA